MPLQRITSGAIPTHPSEVFAWLQFLIADLDRSDAPSRYAVVKIVRFVDAFGADRVRLAEDVSQLLLRPSPLLEHLKNFSKE